MVETAGTWPKLVFMQPVRCARALFSCGMLLLSGCGESPTSEGRAFGTTWSLKAGSAGEFQPVVQAELDRWEAMISNWRPDSAVSKFNASTSTDWQPMPAEVIELVVLARRIAEDMEGALDITQAPVIDLWGFGAGGRRQVPPDDRQIEAARHFCGWHLLDWRVEPPALRKRQPGVRINLSAVAEGWALDRLAARLEAAGLRDCLLELGGEVLARGHGPDGRPWLVGVQAPDAPEGMVLHALRLGNAALGTSGTYRHRFEAGGRSYSHLIDPRSGRPVAHEWRSVSVRHASAALADGYATALLVLGQGKGRLLAEKLGLNVFWVQ